jgi:hypothetical protein
MHPAQLPDQLRPESYCPSCGNYLAPGKCADPWAICLVCKHGHRFFILPEPPLAVHSTTAASLNFPEINNRPPEVIASFWLSEPTARSALNEQLAQLLRAILEARHVLDEPCFSFCPICGETLAEYDQRDNWVQGLCCTGGHPWALRGGRLFSVIGGIHLELHAEAPDPVISQLIAGWLKGSPDFESTLHESIRRVLTSSPLCPNDSVTHSD